MDENPSGCPWCEERQKQIAELEKDRNDNLARAQLAEDDRDVCKKRIAELQDENLLHGAVVARAFEEKQRFEKRIAELEAEREDLALKLGHAKTERNCLAGELSKVQDRAEKAEARAKGER